MKDTNVDDSDAEQVQIVIDSFQESVDQLMRYLYTTPSDEVTLSKLEKMIDVDSFAKYCLINEFCGNAESVASSFYSYKDGLDDVIHLGPVWDFDCSMGNYKNESEYYLSAHVLFNCLLASPAFNNRAQEIFNQYRVAFSGLCSDAAAIKEQIADSATMNFIRWNIWGQPNPKDSLKDYAGSYEEGYQRLANWLHKQTASFSVQETRIPYADVNEQCTAMNILFDNGEDSRTVVFAVWSDQNGQDDLKWYYPEKNADGLWEALVDLSAHNSTGKYTIHASVVKSNQSRERVAVGYAYIDRVNPPEFIANLSDDGCWIETVMRNVGMYDDLSVHVWCETDGDDDLIQYAVQDQVDFSKTCAVQLRDHNEIGMYRLQLHGKRNGSWSLIDETSVLVADKTWPEVSAEVIPEQKTLVVTVENADGFESVEIQTWCEADGQNDKANYLAAKDAEGNWKVIIDLDAHAELGTYQIHVYGLRNGTQNKIAVTQATVENIVFPENTVAVYRLYNGYTQEHLLTANKLEADQLLQGGWLLDGVAWNASKTGTPVYRLYNPYDDWHTYSTSQVEMDMLTALGWTVDGIVFSSTEAANKAPVYRLFNPYEAKNYHLLTASEEERTSLMGLGWLLDGVALNAVLN